MITDGSPSVSPQDALAAIEAHLDALLASSDPVVSAMTEDLLRMRAIASSKRRQLEDGADTTSSGARK